MIVGLEFFFTCVWCRYLPPLITPSQMWNVVNLMRCPYGCILTNDKNNPVSATTATPNLSLECNMGSAAADLGSPGAGYCMSKVCILISSLCNYGEEFWTLFWPGEEVHYIHWKMSFKKVILLNINGFELIKYLFILFNSYEKYIYLYIFRIIETFQCIGVKDIMFAFCSLCMYLLHDANLTQLNYLYMLWINWIYRDSHDYMTLLQFTHMSYTRFHWFKCILLVWQSS